MTLPGCVLMGDREIGAGGANTSDFACQANGDVVHSSVSLNCRPCPAFVLAVAKVGVASTDEG